MAFRATLFRVVKARKDDSSIIRVDTVFPCLDRESTASTPCNDMERQAPALMIPGLNLFDNLYSGTPSL